MVDRALEVDATLDSLPPVAAWLKDAARDSGLSFEIAFGLDLALHEAVENVVRHGQVDARSHRIALRFHCDGDRVEIDVADHGIPFDPRSVPAPVSPPSIGDVIPGGKGIQLMRHFTDEIRYRREAGRNRLTLVRALRPRSEPA